MIRGSLLFAAVGVVVAASGALAQTDNLSEQQRHGRQVFAQSCGVCHLAPSLNARTYGPSLNKASANGDNDIMREYILNGTPRMPAFKYYLNTSDIDAIISYVRTVPAPAAPRQGGGGGGE